MLVKIFNFITNTSPAFLRHPLSRRNRLAPFFRFFYLQLALLLGSAIGKRTVNVRWIHDLVLPIDKGDSGLTGNYYLGLHEYSDMTFILHLLRQNELFIDIGANLGSYSLLASGVARANTLAFEPVPVTYQKLVRCVQHNSLLDKIMTRRLALAERIDSYEQYFTADQGAMNTFAENKYQGQRVLVQVSTLDAECQALDPVAIKIDVEGSEARVLKGGFHTLRNESLLTVISEDRSDQVYKILYEAGFVKIEYFHSTRSISTKLQNLSNSIWIKKNRMLDILYRLSSAEELIS